FTGGPLRRDPGALVAWYPAGRMAGPGAGPVALACPRNAVWPRRCGDRRLPADRDGQLDGYPGARWMGIARPGLGLAAGPPGALVAGWPSSAGGVPRSA